jgi:hypothetical protein
LRDFWKDVAAHRNASLRAKNRGSGDPNGESGLSLHAGSIRRKEKPREGGFRKFGPHWSRALNLASRQIPIAAEKARSVKHLKGSWSSQRPG